jgi:predicted amidohydrolase
VRAEALRIALLHLAPRFGETETNRAALLTAVEAAAGRGAHLILAPELAVSGYSFEDRAQAAALAETREGPTIHALAKVCRRQGVFCAVGLLERDPSTGLLHNSAFLTGPEGHVVGQHRKLVAERRWATPGKPAPASLVDTPWGRLGLLICADSYFSLPARALALRGADLLLVPANWPPSGVDPRRIWRARALENGLGVVACNRTGRDRQMDCTEARSFAVGPNGERLLDAGSPEAATFLVDWPLADGRLVQNRAAALADRHPEEWSALGLDVNGLKDTTYLWGPLPEKPVTLVLATGPMAPPARIEGQPLCVFGLPEGKASAEALDQMRDRPWPSGLVLVGADALGPFLGTEEAVWRLEGRDYLLRFVAGLRLAVARPRSLFYPEVAVALAKEGCDLVLVPSGPLDDALAELAGIRCLERLPLALVTQGEASLFLPPEGHGPWGEIRHREAGPLEMRFDASAYRQRHVFDRIDLDTLLCHPSAI